MSGSAPYPLNTDAAKAVLFGTDCLASDAPGINETAAPGYLPQAPPGIPQAISGPTRTTTPDLKAEARTEEARAAAEQQRRHRRDLHRP